MAEQEHPGVRVRPRRSHRAPASDAEERAVVHPCYSIAVMAPRFAQPSWPVQFPERPLPESSLSLSHCRWALFLLPFFLPLSFSCLVPSRLPSFPALDPAAPPSLNFPSYKLLGAPLPAFHCFSFLQHSSVHHTHTTLFNNLTRITYTPTFVDLFYPPTCLSPPGKPLSPAAGAAAAAMSRGHQLQSRRPFAASGAARARHDVRSFRSNQANPNLSLAISAYVYQQPRHIDPFFWSPFEY